MSLIGPHSSGPIKDGRLQVKALCWCRLDKNQPWVLIAARLHSVSLNYCQQSKIILLLTCDSFFFLPFFGSLSLSLFCQLLASWFHRSSGEADGTEWPTESMPRLIRHACQDFRTESARRTSPIIELNLVHFGKFDLFWAFSHSVMCARQTQIHRNSQKRRESSEQDMGGKSPNRGSLPRLIPSLL